MMVLARIQDALAIWDGSPSPCSRPFFLKVKASICIALGFEVSGWSHYGDHIPVWASEPRTYYSGDGPGQSWHEVAVHPGLRIWTFSRYENGF